MEIFEKKIRGFHAKSIENIMTRTLGSFRRKTKTKKDTNRFDNITTYLRKFEIDRQNLNLAKRILQCESEHSRNRYNKDWKKTKNFLKVRSNFKKNLCNEEPRIFKFQKISGQGNILVTMKIQQIESNMLKFRGENIYGLKVQIGNSILNPTNSYFTLDSLKNYLLAFYIPAVFKTRKISAKLTQIKANNMYEKGKFSINLGQIGQQKQTIMNKKGKKEGSITFNITLSQLNNLKSNEFISLNTQQNNADNLNQ